MIAQYTTPDGFTLTVSGTGTSEYALKVEKDSKVLHHSYFFSGDSYGFHYEDDQEEPVIWGEKEWQDCLKDEADSIIDCTIGHILEMEY